MAVGVQCDGDRSMPEALADDLRVHFSLEGEGRVGVAKIMEADSRDTRSPDPLLELVTEPVRVDRLAYGSRKDKIPLGVLWLGVGFGGALSLLPRWTRPSAATR